MATRKKRKAVKKTAPRKRAPMGSVLDLAIVPDQVRTWADGVAMVLYIERKFGLDVDLEEAWETTIRGMLKPEQARLWTTLTSQERLLHMRNGAFSFERFVSEVAWIQRKDSRKRSQAAARCYARGQASA